MKSGGILRRALLAAVPVTAGVALLDPAYAQEPGATSPSAAEAPQLQRVEEIVVTAQKRSENLQDVPIAVSAVTATTLARAGAKDLVDIRSLIPSLNTTNSNGRLTLSLRGIGASAVGAGIENPIALYVDGVYFGAPVASLLSLNNIERIEVLKGPQGTLFGRNATGGLVQIITRTPTQRFSVAGNLSYANYRDVTGNLYVSGGVAPNLAADVAAYVRHRGEGWGKNLGNGQDVYDLAHDVAVRSKWVFTPGTDTTMTLIGDYADTKDRSLPLVGRGGSVSLFQSGLLPDLGYDTNLSSPVLQHTVRSGGASLRIDQLFGSVQLSSISAFRKSRAFLPGDLDNTPAALESFEVVQHDKQFSEELQLSSKGASPFKWTTGLFYYTASSDDPALVPLADLGIVSELGNGAQKTRSAAAYGQASYEFLPRTQVTLGGRFTREKKETDQVSARVYLIGTTPGPFFFVPDDHVTSKKFTFRASLDHRFSEEVLAYASFNRGFKSGGFNIASPGSPAFLPETLDAYEVGVKSDLFDRRLRLNVSGFYYNYTNVQVIKIVQGGINTLNGGKARSYGVDADLTAVLAEGLQLRAGAGLVSPRFGKFDDCVGGGPLGGVPPGTRNCTGNLLPLASKFVTSAALEYSADVGGGRLDLNGNVYHNSGFYFEVDNAIHQPAFTQFGASVRWTMPGDRFYIGAFGRNLSDKRVLTYGVTQPTGLQQVLYAEPRTYGVNVGFNF